MVTSRPRRRLRSAIAVAAVGATVVAVALSPPAAQARALDPGGGASKVDAPPSDTVDPKERDRVLAPGWRKSDDLVWTTSGDSTGLHVLVATARSGYGWKTVASLAEPGFDADMWIGNACVTGSGRRLVVVYGPRTFTNDPDLFDRGGFTAVVDLHSGAVRKLPVQSSLAYFNPGCGTGEKAVLSQYGGKRIDDPKVKGLHSRLITVDVAKGVIGKPLLRPGQPLCTGHGGAAGRARHGGGAARTVPAHRRPHRFDLRCWYHQSVQWKGGPGTTCATCGNESVRFDPGYAYQDDGGSYPPNCGTMPSTWLIIDDQLDGTPSVRPDCARTFSNAGSFGFEFAPDGSGNYPSKVDLHQIGGGFSGHFFFGRTRTSAMHGGKLRVNGTWRLTNPISGWYKVKVAVPDHRAFTRQADYVINLGNGVTRHRVIGQVRKANTWVDLGLFNFNGRGSVSLSTVTRDGIGEESIAWDAVAFERASTPVAQYVAMGDSYSSGEGIDCHRSTRDGWTWTPPT